MSSTINKVIYIRSSVYVIRYMVVYEIVLGFRTSEGNTELLTQSQATLFPSENYKRTHFISVIDKMNNTDKMCFLMCQNRMISIKVVRYHALYKLVQ